MQKTILYEITYWNRNNYLEEKLAQFFGGVIVTVGIGLVGVVMDPWLAWGVASLEIFFGRFLAVEDLKKGRKESATLLQWNKSTGNGFLLQYVKFPWTAIRTYLIFPAKSGLIAYSQSYKSFSFIVWIKKTFCLVVMLKVFLTICCCSAEYSVLACAKLIRPRSQ